MLMHTALCLKIYLYEHANQMKYEYIMTNLQNLNNACSSHSAKCYLIYRRFQCYTIS